MNKKQWIGVGVLVVGIIGVLYSVYLMHRISELKKDIHTLTHPFAENFMSGEVGETLRSQASQYDAQIMMILIGGITLAILGSAVTFFCRK